MSIRFSEDELMGAKVVSTPAVQTPIFSEDDLAGARVVRESGPIRSATEENKFKDLNALLNEHGDSTNWLQETFRDPKKLIDEGYNPDEVLAARTYVRDEIRGIMESASDPFWTDKGRWAALNFAKNQKPTTDEEWEKFVWDEPTIGDHLQSWERTITRSTIEVLMNAAGGNAAALSLAADALGQPKMAESLRGYAADRKEDTAAARQFWPTDPRLHMATSLAQDAIGQAPAQIATIPSTILNLTANFGQIYSDVAENYREAELGVEHQRALTGGLIPEGTSRSEYVAGLSKEEKQDIVAAAEAKALVVALPISVLQTGADKLIAGKVLGPVFRRIPGAKWVERAVVKAAGQPSTHSMGRRIIGRIAGAGGVEALQESLLEGMVRDLGEGVLITGEYAKAFDLKTRGIEAYAGAVGGAAMGGAFAGPAEATRQRGFDWASKVLDGTAQEVVENKATLEEFSGYPDTLQYKQAKAAIIRTEDHAHYLLDLYGDHNRADQSRVTRYMEYTKTQQTAKEAFKGWLQGYDADLANADTRYAEVSKTITALDEAHASRMAGAKALGPDVAKAAEELHEVEKQKAYNKLAQIEADLAEAHKQWVAGEEGKPPVELQRSRIAQWAVQNDSHQADDILNRPPQEVELVYQGLFDAQGNPRPEGDPDRINDLSPDGVAAWLKGRDERVASEVEKIIAPVATPVEPAAAPVEPTTPAVEPATPAPTGVTPTDTPTPTLTYARLLNAKADEELLGTQEGPAAQALLEFEAANPTVVSEYLNRMNTGQDTEESAAPADVPVDGDGQVVMPFDAPRDQRPVPAPEFETEPARIDNREGQEELPLFPINATPEEQARALELQRQLANSPERQAAVRALLIERGQPAERVDAFLSSLPKPDAKETPQTPTPTGQQPPAPTAAKAPKGRAQSKPANPAVSGSNREATPSRAELSPQEERRLTFKENLKAQLLAEKPAHLTENEWAVKVAGMEANFEAAVKKASVAISAIERGSTEYTAKNADDILTAMLNPQEQDKKKQNAEEKGDARGSRGKNTLIGQMLDNFRLTGSLVHTRENVEVPYTDSKGKKRVRKERTGKVVGWQVGKWVNDWAKREAQGRDRFLDDRPVDAFIENDSESDFEVNNEVAQGGAQTTPVIEGSFDTKENRADALEKVYSVLDTAFNNVAESVAGDVTVSAQYSDTSVLIATEGVIRQLYANALAKAGVSASADITEAIGLAKAANPVLFKAIEKQLSKQGAALFMRINEQAKKAIGSNLRNSYRANYSAATLAAEGLDGLATFTLSMASADLEQNQAMVREAIAQRDVTKLAEYQAALVYRIPGNRELLDAIVEDAMREDGVIAPKNLSPKLRAKWFSKYLTNERLIKLEQRPEFPVALREANEGLRKLVGNDPAKFMAEQKFSPAVALIGQLEQGSASDSRLVVQALTNRGDRDLPIPDRLAPPKAKDLTLTFNWALPESVAQGFATGPGLRNLHISTGVFKGTLNDPKGGALVAKTVLHEYLHPRLEPKINAYLNKRTDLLREQDRKGFEILEQLMDEAREVRLAQIMEGKGPEFTRVMAEQELAADRDYAGLGSLHEFINEASNHRAFQDFLAGITTNVDGRSTTIWQRIVNLITRLLTGRDVAMDSSLQRAMEEGLRLSSDTQIYADPVLQRAFLDGTFALEYDGRTTEEALSDPEVAEAAARRYAELSAEFRRLRNDDRGSEGLRALTGEPSSPEPTLVGPLAEVAAENELRREAGKNTGFEFVSPNDLDAEMSFDQANALLNGQQQKDFRAYADEVNAWIDPQAELIDGVGDWADGAEPTLLTRHKTDISYDNLKVSVALKSAYRRQKAGIPFKVDPEGNQFLYEFFIPNTSAKAARDIVIAAGIEHRTLIEQNGGVAVYVFDAPETAENAAALRDKIEALTTKNNYEYTYRQGRGEFLGSWDSREEGHAVFRQVVGAALEGEGLEGSQGRGDSDRASRLRKLADKAGIQFSAAQPNVPIIYKTGTDRANQSRGPQSVGLFRARIESSDTGGSESAGSRSNERLARFEDARRIAAASGLEIIPPFFRSQIANDRNYLSGGAEHLVYRLPKGNRVIKVSHEDVSTYGSVGGRSDILEYMNGMALSNAIFGSDTHFEGLVKLDGELPQVVTSQPFIRGRKATEAEIAADLTRRGFTIREDADGLWEHKGIGVRIYDAVPVNVLRAASTGQLHYIDVEVEATRPVAEVLAELEQPAPTTTRFSAAPIKFRRTLSELEQLAVGSAEFKTWFSDFEGWLKDYLGENQDYAPLVGEILAATSAATTVESNVPIAAKVLRSFIETGAAPVDLLPAHKGNVSKAFAGEKLSGPKISEYSSALFGNPDAVPVDRHILQIFFGIDKTNSPRKLNAAKARIVKIAERLGWEPRQVMAALWAANQKLNDQTPTTYEQHLEKHRESLRALFTADRSGEGRGLQAARRIAERVRQGRRPAGDTDGSTGRTRFSAAQPDLTQGTPEASVYEALTGEGVQGTTRPSEPVATPVEVSRFQELTADLQGRELTQGDLDAWKQANPEAYAELEKMREAVLRRAGYDITPWFHGGKFNPAKDPIPVIKDGKKSKSNMQMDFGLHLAENPEEAKAYVPNKGGALTKLFLANTDIGGKIANLSNNAPWIVTKQEAQKFGPKVQKLIEKQRAFNEKIAPEVDPISGDIPVYPAQLEGILSSIAPSEAVEALRNAGYTGVEYTAKANYGTGRYRPFRAITLIGSPSQIKSADPLNLEDGKLVTPDQWADSGSPDIRFSAPVVSPQMDADYMVAVEAGDMETAQRMVDEAARAAGYNIGPVWHWTPAEFTVFDLNKGDEGHHFGTEFAAHRRAQAKTEVFPPKTDTIRAFLRGRVRKVDDMMSNDAVALLMQLQTARRIPKEPRGPASPYSIVEGASKKRRINSEEGAKLGAQLLEEYQRDVQRTEDAIGRQLMHPMEELQLLLGDELTVFSYTNKHEDHGSTSYAVTRSEQIKSADPVTRDEQGNVIPLSQRFNPENPDIRFSAPAYTFPAAGSEVIARDSLKETKAFERLRQSPNFPDIRQIMRGRQHIPETQSDLNERANAFIEDYLASHPTDNFLDFKDIHRDILKAAALAPELSSGVKILVKANVAMRVRAMRDSLRRRAEDMGSSAQEYEVISTIAEFYDRDYADNVLELSEMASERGHELNYFRMVSQLMEPSHWRRQYTRPTIKLQSETLQNKRSVKLIDEALAEAVQTSKKNTYTRMLAVLRAASRRFLPPTATEEQVRAAAQFAQAMSDRMAMSNTELVQHATELLVAHVHSNTLRRFENVPKSPLKQRFMDDREQRARALAKEQIEAVVKRKLDEGGVVDDPAKPTLTREQKLEELWRDIAGTTEVDPMAGLAEIIFNQVMMESEDANTPYSGLFANNPSLWNPDYKFDTEGLAMLRRAVQQSVSLSEEVRKSLNDRAITERDLVRKLEAYAPHLTPEQRTKVADAVVSIYRAEVQAETERALGRLVERAKQKDGLKNQESMELLKALGTKTSIGKLLEVINMGAFSKEDVYNAIAESYGLPTYDKNTADRIAKMAEDMQRLTPDSIQRSEAAQLLGVELLEAHRDAATKWGKVGYWIKMLGLIWQAGALQGIRTQMVNFVASLGATEMEASFAAAGHAIYAQTQGAGVGQAWGAMVPQIVHGVTRTFGMNLENTSRRFYDENFAATERGMTRHRSEKLESLGEMEAHKAEAMLAEQGKRFVRAWGEPSLVKRTGKVALEGTLLAAKYAYSYPKNMSIALARTLTGNKEEAAQALKRIVDNFIAERKMVGRFMLASDAVNSSIGTNTKLLLMQRTGELLGDPQFVGKIADDVAANAKAVAEAEAADGQFGTPGTAEFNNMKARRIEQLFEREFFGRDAVEAAREAGAKGTFNGDAYGIPGFIGMALSRTLMPLGPAGVPFGSFMRTMSNLINYALELSPYGFARAARGGQGTLSSLLLSEGGKEFVENFKTYEKGSPEQYAAYVRAGVGSAVYLSLAAMVYAALKGWEERREEPLIQFYGPGDPDPRVRRAQREAGIAKPYHIRYGHGADAVWIPYRDLPGLFLPLSIAGVASDRMMSEDYDPEEKINFWMDTMLMGSAVVLDRNMTQGLNNLLMGLADPSLSPEERRRKLGELSRGMVGPYANPGMIKFIEDLASGTRYDLAGWKAIAASSLPFGNAVAGQPQLNVLAEPVSLPWEDVLFGRFFSATHVHPKLGPLAAAGLTVPAPTIRGAIADPERQFGVRPPTPEETRAYNIAYGERMNELLTPERVKSLAERAKAGRAGQQSAQEQLSKLGTAASNAAWRAMREDLGLRKGDKKKAIARMKSWTDE